MKYIESNIPSNLSVRVHHYHPGNTVDLQDRERVQFVTHAWLVNKKGRCVSDAISVCTGRKAKRAIRRQIAVGRALKQYMTQQGGSK